MPLLLALGLVGCVAPSPRVMHYADYNLIIADPAQVDRACQQPGGRWDDGRIIRWDEHNAGCWIPSKREMWLRWDAEGAEAKPHEDCHREGHINCEAYNWPQ